MKPINAAIDHLDAFQRKFRLPGFIYGVIKKYGDDQAGYQAALLTYYGFLALFPLLLLLTTVASMVARDNPALQQDIISSMTNYFPVLGNQLADHVEGIHKTGFALVVGVLFTLYGARGVADAFQHGVNHIWGTPQERRDGFPKALLKNLAIVFIGGVGLLLASVCAGLAASTSHGFVSRLLAALINIIIFSALFTVLLNLILPRHVSVKEARSGALTAAIGLVLLQTFGGYILGRQLKTIDAVYSYFAVALGLMFWIYLQALAIYYAIEITSVRTEKLWPRSLTGKATEADKRAYTRQAKKERMLPKEDQSIEVSFSKKA